MLMRRVWPSRPTFDNGFSELEHLRREMLRLLDPTTADVSGETAGVFPPINITQDDDNFYVRAEIPGIKPSELSISAVRNRLSIAGRREIEPEHEHVSYHRKERAEGTFNRAVALPMEVDAERVVAKYGHGILSLTLPKAEQAKPRQITVKS
jgi:HSP20 family protein